MGEQNLVLIGKEHNTGKGDNGGSGKIVFGVLLALIVGCGGGYIYFKATTRYMNMHRPVYPPPSWYQDRQNNYGQPQVNVYQKSQQSQGGETESQGQFQQGVQQSQEQKGVGEEQQAYSAPGQVQSPYQVKVIGQDQPETPGAPVEQEQQGKIQADGQAGGQAEVPAPAAAAGQSANSTVTENPTTEASGLWTDWTEWSACSTSCGGGARSRARKCAAGQICAGNNRDWQICNHQCCKVDGQWNSWSQWAARRTNMLTRIRTCDMPAPSCGGAGCVGQATETQRIVR